MARFQGKVVLITGGGTGIGRTTAIMFANEGANVVIGNRNEERGRAVVNEITDAGGQATFLRTDVVNEADVKALVNHAIETFGRIDVAFNNAGIEGAIAPTHEATIENFDNVWNVNVRGLWFCMHHVIKQMLAQGDGGSIINNSSIAGVIGFPAFAHYIASKHAVMGLTKSAALEYATAGIRVNAVNPAVIETPMADRLGESFGMNDDEMAAMHPVGRTGRPEEVATVVLFLASDESSFITGQPILIDGGFTAH